MYDPELMDKFVRPASMYDVKGDEIDRYVTLLHLSEAYIGSLPENVSYGSYMQSYTNALERYQHEEGDKSHVALLAGALSRDTIREFSTTVKTVFPDSHTVAMDLVGGKKAAVNAGLSDFVVGDVLMTPFRDEVFDTLHTSALLRSLEHDGERNQAYDVRKVFLENAYRVLKPGGALIMIEMAQNPEYKDFKKRLAAELKVAGFISSSFENGWAFRNRDNLYNHLSGTDQEIPKDHLIENPYTMLVYAKK